MEKHIWIKSLTIDDKGYISEEMPIILSTSLETKQLKLKGTEEKTINDTFIKVSFSNKKARTCFYKNPISLGKNNYVMYKRSASSSRQGNVLFIRSDLFAKMDKWSNCGIDLTDPKSKEKVSKNFLAFQAYKALTLSGCQGFLNLNPKNILVINDLESVFNKEVLVVTDKKPEIECPIHPLHIAKKIYTYEGFEQIKNCIWDGQGLLEDSFFADNGYCDKSMMILRNRFFKSCVFRTKLNKWFNDNHLFGEIERDADGKPTRINGYTEAINYEDIQMVITYSSLKYIKFYNEPISAIRKWMATANSLFGIVKTDKKTDYFGGNYVKTNYQLLNTISMTEDNVAVFLEPNKRMIEKIANDSKAFIVYQNSINGKMDDILEEKEIKIDKYFDKSFGESDSYFNPRLSVCCNLIKLSTKFDKTSFYRTFIRDYIKQLCRNIGLGRVLVKGTYATIFGNPIEMLEYIVKNYDIKPGTMGEPLMRGKIYSPFFADGEKILGSRSPHILPGNILIADNKSDYRIDDYFVLNREIVCINSIGEVILDRLNGSDQDGDTILLTNDSSLVDCANRFVGRYMDRFGTEKFTVPVNRISSLAEEEKINFIDDNNEINMKAFAEADHKFANNNIGKIINLSQKYNSILWDIFNNKYHNNSNYMHLLYKIYALNCILEVLSNIEIDAAKGKTSFKSEEIYSVLNKEADIISNKKDPLFFAGLKEKKIHFEIDRKPENKGQLAIKDDSSNKYLWFAKTTSDIDAIVLDSGLWIYKSDKRNFRRNDSTKHLSVGDEGLFVFIHVINKGSKPKRYAVLIKDESLLERFENHIHWFESVKDALDYNWYSQNEIYVIRGYISAFATFNYEKYDTTMDYVYESSKIKPDANYSEYVKLSECYRSDIIKAPKNNCDQIAQKFIERLMVAEKVRRALFNNSKNDLDLLNKVGLPKGSSRIDYLKYLRKCAVFGNDNYFSSKDRIKSLIRIIDEKDKENVRNVFYLALFFMFDEENPHKKYLELFEHDTARSDLSVSDIDRLFEC